MTAPAPAPRHLLTVWNPSYASDGLNDHLRILLGLAKRARAGELTDNGPAISYAKALEAELNDLVFGRLARHFARRAERDRLLHVDGRTIDLGGPLPHFTLGVVSRLLAEDGIVRSAVRSIFPSQDAKWLEGMLPNELAPIIEQRNPAAHSVALSLTEVARLRAQVVGIGREGLIAMLARVRLRTR